jgi:hypothetical protein
VRPLRELHLVGGVARVQVAVDVDGGIARADGEADRTRAAMVVVEIAAAAPLGAVIVVVTVVPVMVIARGAARQIFELALAFAGLHVMVQLDRVVADHVDHHAMAAVAVELEADLVAAGRQVQALEDAVEVVGDAGVVPVDVHPGLRGLDEDAHGAGVAVVVIPIGVARIPIAVAAVIGV